MIDARLRDTDFNLLFVLHILLTERSVKAAAAQLGVTQSAASHSLAKLRKIFDDQLLVRASGGMQLTARAEDLQEPLARVVAGVTEVLGAGPCFDPDTARRTIPLLTADFAELIVLPALMRRLATEAPGIDIVIRPRQPDMFEALATGAAELAFGRFMTAPAGFYRQTLFTERFASIVRADHPRVSGSLTMDEFLALDHILVSPRGQATGVVDAALARNGQQRRIALMVPHFLVAPLIVAETDYVQTLPERIARRFASLLPITILEPPCELPSFAIAQVWHERMHRDAGHQWLRATVADVARDL